MEEKTNVMRLLDQKKVAYTRHYYPALGPVDGVSVAALIGQDVSLAYKTLVTRGASGAYHVFVIPVALSLQLKPAAKAVGEKSIEMIRQAELLPLTGYVHGGCSPLGMKKRLNTVLDQSAGDKPTIVCSAGRIGAQVELAPADLCALTGGKLAAVAE